MTDAIRFLNPAVLASISNLELRAKTTVEGFLNGLHKSPYHGFSVEFSDYRHYYPGDDIRHVDWKVYARSEKYYIKQYEDETNVRCHILLDCSGSMGYGSDGMSKLEYGKTLASALAYFMMGQRDSVGLTTFDHKMRDYLPSKYRRGHLMQILQTLTRTQLGKHTDIMRPISDLAFSLNRKSIIILISDLLADETELVKGFQQLRYKGSDFIVFHVMDNAELTFPFERASDFIDLESEERLMVEPHAIREGYLEEIEKFCAFYRKQCQQNDIDYCLLNTSHSLDEALSAYLTRRSRSF